MRKPTFAFLTPALLILAFWLISAKIVKSSVNDSDLILTVNSDKESYILGEQVNLRFEITHKKNKIITLRSAPTVENGDIRVWIASSNRNFKQYRGARWGFDEGGKPRKEKSFKSQAGILWNGKAPDSSKNESFDKNRIETDYAFVEAGVYFIKATATVFNEDAKSDDDKISIESEPIQIIVNEPVGDDLEVWKNIKDNGALGLFMQTGRLLNEKPAEAQKLLKEVEDIISKYPDSLLVGQLKNGLEKYRLEQAEIEKEKERIQNNKKKPQ